MQHSKSDCENSPLLPGDAQPCIWMTAGLIAYRLCDRDYDCDDCPLDIALRHGGRKEPESHTDPALDLRFGTSHIWIQRMTGRRIRCGLDAFAADLLAFVSGVVLPVRGQRVRRGRIACWFRDEDRVLPLRMSVSGVVHRINRSIQSDPGLLSHDPYGRGWLFELDGTTDLDKIPDLVSPAQQARRIESSRRLLRESAARILGTDPRVGPTLADGGMQVTDLRRTLGARRYFRWVRSILE